MRESGLATEAVVGFILDLDALCVVVQSAIEGLTAVASVAKKAMARLKEQHLAVYLEKLLETDFFKAVMAVVTNLVQVSAKDEVARSKLQSTRYKLIVGLAKKRLALMQHVVQDDGNPVTPVKKKHVKQPATETTMNLMDDIDAITAKGKGGIVADAAMDVAPAPLCT